MAFVSLSQTVPREQRGVCTSKIPRQHDMIVVSVVIAWDVQLAASSSNY